MRQRYPLDVLHHMWTQSYPLLGGAHNRLCPSLSRLWHLCLRLYHRLTPTANARQFVPVPDLAAALVDTASREGPVLSSRWLPPTQNFCKGGVLRYHALKWDTQQLTSEVSKKKLV